MTNNTLEFHVPELPRVVGRYSMQRSGVDNAICVYDVISDTTCRIGQNGRVISDALQFFEFNDTSDFFSALVDFDKALAERVLHY